MERKFLSAKEALGLEPIGQGSATQPGYGFAPPTVLPAPAAPPFAVTAPGTVTALLRFGRPVLELIKSGRGSRFSVMAGLEGMPNFDPEVIEQLFALLEADRLVERMGTGPNPSYRLTEIGMTLV